MKIHCSLCLATLLCLVCSILSSGGAALLPGDAAIAPANSVLSKSLTTSSKLVAARSGQNLVLSWPTNVDGLTLQSAQISSANATWSDVS